MSKEKQNRNQYIITYDIENSKIYEVWYYYKYRNLYVKCPIYQKYLTEYMKIETSYITEENKKRAESIINWSNEKHDMHYELVGFTHKYIANFYIYDLQTREIISKFSYEPYTDNEIFEQLIDMWLTDCDIMLTAHNLDYEFNYLKYNTNLLQTLIKKCSDYKIIAESISNIKSLEFTSETGSKFYIRDTYLMSNKSIKNLGNTYNLPKLEYDYDVTRIYRYDINDTDRNYNQRDNEIAMEYIKELMNILPIYQNVNKLPISITQHSKNICKYNKSVNYKPGNSKTDLFTKHKILSCKYNIHDFDLYRSFFNASGGGLIGVNKNFTGKWLKDVHSFDIKSAHPSQFYNKVFPLGDSIREVNNYDWIIEKYLYLSSMLQNEPKNFYNHFLPEYDYLLLVEFTDLKAKDLKNKNIILSLGSGKQVQNYNENFLTERTAFNYKAETINGKTIKSKVYRKWLFGIDLIYHLSFYGYKDLKIIKAYKYKMMHCDEYIISKSDYYGKYKEVYKKMKFFAKENDFNTTLNECIKNELEEYTIKNLDQGTYINFLDTELIRIKGIFNGLFGQEYQNIYHEDMQFTEDLNIESSEKRMEIEEIRKKYNNMIDGSIKDRTTVHYCVGAYTAAWSRFELACMIWHCINNNGIIYYYHTDSIKCGNCENTIFDNWYDEKSNNSHWRKHNIYGFGGVTYEETFNYFYTPETLKCIGIENKKGKILLNITLSGIKEDIYFKDIHKKYDKQDFNEENIKNLLQELTEKLQPQIIPPELTGKLVRETKFCGLKSELGQINFGVLQPTPYNFLRKKDDEK